MRGPESVEVTPDHSRPINPLLGERARLAVRYMATAPETSLRNINKTFGKEVEAVAD